MFFICRINNLFLKLTASLTILVFFAGSLPFSYAQNAATATLKPFQPLVIQGMKFSEDNAFKFDFLRQADGGQ